MLVSLSEQDIAEMPDDLRQGLNAWIADRVGFGGYKLEEEKAFSIDDVLREPVELDQVAWELIYDGVNDSARAILDVFIRNHGHASVDELLAAIRVDQPRFLNGPMGGIVRKLRSLFGGLKVDPWNFDADTKTYWMTGWDAAWDGQNDEDVWYERGSHAAARWRFEQEQERIKKLPLEEQEKIAAEQNREFQAMLKRYGSGKNGNVSEEDKNLKAEAEKRYNDRKTIEHLYRNGRGLEVLESHAESGGRW